MNIVFTKLILHNFLSYAHSEIDLTDKSYCLVKGINNCPRDNAVSNGAGKSSWISGLCWALTGETIQGVTKDIKNIYIDEDSCYVTLYFKVDSDEYIITRIKEPKPDLKLMINGVDKSGKGIRESEEQLAQILPGLTSELIGSVIILGQGLPQKFTNNSPSGRKEVLEKLSKSDFMIQDIKDRISNRINKLNSSLRNLEDNQLTLSSQESIYKGQLSEAQKCVENLSLNIDYDKKLLELNEEKDKFQRKLNEIQKLSTEVDSALSSTETEMSELLKIKSDSLNEINEKYYQLELSQNNIVNTLANNINNIKVEINKLESISDICPTCGQKIPGAVKPDTTEQRVQLAVLEEQYKTEDTKRNCIKEDKKQEIIVVQETYTKQYEDKNNSRLNLQSQKQLLSQDLLIVSNELINNNTQYSNIVSEKTNREKSLKEAQDKVLYLESILTKINTDLVYNNTEMITVKNHLDVLNKMSTLVKRDFRGFLLSDVINFIDRKSKEYCKDVFGTEELEFKLNGNNIDISYCHKNFESLSGGEKQKVNIIIQFAIREMMSTYLDFHSNCLMLDEIFDNLDVIGTSNIINLISTKLTDLESIFIISHHDDLECPSDTELVIVKDVHGISRVQ